MSFVRKHDNSMQTEDAAREEIRRGIRMSRDAFNRRKEIMSGGISQTLEIQIIRIWSVMQNCSSLYPGLAHRRAVRIIIRALENQEKMI